jgi:hypothetical protein
MAYFACTLSVVHLTRAVPNQQAISSAVAKKHSFRHHAVGKLAFRRPWLRWGS